MTKCTAIGSRLLLATGCLLACALLTGCPALLPALQVSPTALSFGDIGTQESFTVVNTGGGELSWVVAITTSNGGNWLTADVAAGITTTETDRIKLTASRTGLTPGDYNATITITSNAGTQTIRVALTAPGTPSIQVDPDTVAFGSTETTGAFTISNLGTGSVNWALISQGASSALPAWLEANPSSGTIPESGSAPVNLTVDRALLPAGLQSYNLLVNSAGGSRTVTLSFSGGVTSQAEITADPDSLDFGIETNALSFDVYNSGEVGSTLNFTVASDKPQLVIPQTTTGTSVAGEGQANQDRVKIVVTLDRTAIEQDEETATLTISAPGVQSVTVSVKAKRAPLTFEGAQNRARPPFLQRFVFLLRDSVGRALDTTDPTVLEALQTAFSIYQDDKPLDLDESSLFVTGAKNLRYNVTLLLDYTGSMYDAEPGNGEAINQMESAAADFITALPDTYRVSLMEYHERQQTDRLIHGFSTARQPILDALSTFSLPAADHGASEIYDALADAITRLANEDTNALPFDDADVRALVFISDGRDTSSLKTKEEMLTLAKDNRVRLYPIGFGDRVESDSLRDIATQSGGHYYPAPTVADLAHLLSQQTNTPPGTPGLIVTELQRQVVLTYVALYQGGSHTYLVTADYKGETGSFQRDGVFTDGDVRAGQLELRTAGIQSDGTAEVILRSEYIPRNISQLRLRFFTGPIQPNYTVEIVPDGLLQGWTLVPETETPPRIATSRVFTVLTTENTPLRYADFGNLLRIRFTGLQPSDQFALGLRIDNRVYVNPSVSKFFQYPEGILIEEGSSQATVFPLAANNGFDPDANGAWDADADTFDDFDDLYPVDPLKH